MATQIENFQKTLIALLRTSQDCVNRASSLLLTLDQETEFLEKVSKCEGMIEQYPTIMHLYDESVKNLPLNEDQKRCFKRVFNRIDVHLQESKDNISQKANLYSQRVAEYNEYFLDPTVISNGIVMVTPSNLLLKYKEFIEKTFDILDGFYDNGHVTFNTGQEFADFFFPIVRYSCFMAAYTAVCDVALARLKAGDVDGCSQLMDMVRANPTLAELENFQYQPLGENYGPGNDVTNTSMINDHLLGYDKPSEQGYYLEYDPSTSHNSGLTGRHDGCYDNDDDASTQQAYLSDNGNSSDDCNLLKYNDFM
ncbi:hypothetical protein H4219_005695, partial [Mycoemilia scoparia]